MMPEEEIDINEDIGFDSNDAKRFLSKKLGTPPTNVTLIGEGAWSRCFGFCHEDEALVIRFGKYVDDFERDKQAYQYATLDLPIPEVRDIGSHGDLYYAISTRVHGVPLESVTSEQWRAAVPSLASAMEAMRSADLSSTSGIGGWGADGNAPWSTWTERLLSIDADTPDMRTYGWRKQLAEASPEGEADFDWGYNLLREVASDDVPRSLLHCDLINRNVLVEGERISGVFDWGCSIYGDHFYELAIIEFWAPWFPELDMSYLRSELERRWQDIGYAPPDKDIRLATSYLHIGIEHIAYNAYLGDWPTMSATAARMRALVGDMS